MEETSAPDAPLTKGYMKMQDVPHEKHQIHVFDILVV